MDARRRWLFVLVLLSLACVGLVAAFNDRPAVAAPGEDDTPAPNPDLVASCGIDIQVVLDRSGSIGQAGATNQVKQAFRAFTTALDNTGSRMSVSDFSTVARLPIPTYTTVTDATIASTFDPYINSYTSSGSTNWEDGFRVPRYFAPRPDPNRPFLVLYMTDGNPNVVVNTGKVTYDPGNPNLAQNQYELQLPLTSNQTQALQDNEAGRNQATSPAISNANALKASGGHVLAVAVGDGLNGSGTLSRLQSISGPDVFSGAGTFDISTTDIYRVDDFSHLEDALREAAFQLCAPSITVHKQIDQNPDPLVDDLQPGQGWQMTATASPTPESWVLPAGATGNTATTTADAAGFATFQWSTTTPADSNFTIAEAIQPGYTNDQTKTRCTYITPDIRTPRPLPNFAVTNGGFSGTVPDDAIATCDMVNRLVPTPGVDIEKSTNGADADAAPGPSIPVGSPVTWSYLVTNTGNVPLNSIAVTDDILGAITCPGTSLAPGETMTCTATGVAVAGQYENNGTVTAVPTSGGTVTDTDPSHYFGSAAGIDIEKATNGDDADLAPGPFIPVGDPVTWTYVVTNTGNSALDNVVVSDDQIGPITCPATTLAVGASMTCTATGTAAAGQYENVATATGDSAGVTVSDSDTSHYFGEVLGITLQKATNGDDADAAPGPFITVGDRVLWTYTFTNTGNVPLRFDVTDDQGVLPACPRILFLVPGRSLTCFAGGTAQAGQYTNVGTVVGTALSGNTVTASDPSNYFGVTADIQLVKFTNGDDANEPPGPFIPVGGPVVWSYEVTNTGNSDLSQIEVTDDQVGPITCPQTTLAAGASMTCTATSTAQPEQYTNFALVTGVPPTGGLVQDLDNSNYFGAIGSIVIVKSTNGVDANDAPGPLILDGQPVNWTYDVTDSGNTTVTNVQVTDDHGDVVVTCPKTTLAPQETMRCTANGTATEGQYDNVGTVTATGPTGALTASDPSNYFGAEPAIAIQKLTNGDDANTPTGPVVPIGDPVTWTYVVTNPGNIALHDVHVVDDKGVVPVFQSGDTNNDSILDPGETWNYQATGTATAGQYENTATVTGTVPFEQPMTVTASDPSHYFGEDPGIAIDKSVDKTVVAPGETVTYTITVTNTGNVALHDVVVSDPKVPACDRTIGDLAPGQSVSYTCSFVVTEPIDNVATVTGKNNTTVDGTDDARVGLVAGASTGPSSGGGSLPFTGSTPWAIVLVGILAVAGGLGAASLDRGRRRRARAWLDDKTRSIRSRLKPTF